ncbi:putative bifunctional diguanylate cyclase/phosphodiesterase [Sphingomonas yantingensis]|uniref:Diguanylate cyclase (GGDEF)-like protein/PAS domain S-box-containing protein n=1 Tax=Sphingomonas yantingensis TaxID=1241761 RepID=A0A7W9AS93_9SPHN|nr:diguanylate cyclase (GGDEF)-like protein/PAS domain S-box-containing protein [Sphingomonas yantingensis]
MKSAAPIPPARPPIDGPALLGIRDVRDGFDWPRIRAAQIGGGAQFALMLLAANVLGAGIVTVLLAGQAPAWQRILWAAIVGATSLFVVFHRLSARNRTRTAASLSDIRRTALDGLALGIVWAVVPLWLAPLDGNDAVLGVWMMLIVLMTASAMAMATLPLASIAFLATLSAAMGLSLALAAHPALGLAILVLAAILGVASFSRARAMAIVHAQQLALAERDETVSLLLREFEESNADWLWEIDAQRRVVRAGARFALTLGLDPTGLDGMPLLQLLAGPDWETGKFAPSLRVLADKLKAREAFRDLILQVEVAGQQRWWQLAANPRFDDAGTFIGFRGVGSDVTEARQSTDRINRMARYDLLTGLPNRLLVNEALGQAMADADKWGSRCAFMMIDLDRFKAVNDTLGHPVGDRLLGRVSERLREMMTENEIIGRLGGDEFAVVVRDARDTERLENLARTIIAKLSRPYEVDQHTLYIGASVGLAVGPRDGRTAEMLVRSADLALYRSKDAGGGVFHAYEPQLHVAAEERRILEIALRGALQNDELHLYFQPVVDAATTQLTGFEALLRWTHPELGPISPSKFIPLAEDARLIAPIGEWVLRHACAEAACWSDDLRISVNVSSEQLHNPAFVSVVAQALSQSGLRPDRLELEVTESVFLREGTGAIRVLDQLLGLGCRLSLDDFGTGYSSLGYLSRTRFSAIKIDRSFVQAAATGGREATAIIRAVVALADSLGMATVAEGVETEEEHRVVAALGCDKVQGYYFGRPLPVAEARALMGVPTGGDSVAA